MHKKLTLFLFLICSSLAVGQSKYAKLKFDQAQEYYNAKDYSLTLLALDETEKILGSTNPRILHLRILASSKIVMANMESEIQLLASLKKDINYYFNNYKDVSSMRNEYQQITKIANEIKAVATREKLTQIENANKESETERVEIENKKIVNRQKYIRLFEEKYKFKKDITVDDFLKINTAAEKMLRAKGIKSGGITYYNTTVKPNEPFPIGPYSANVNDENKIIFYSEIINSTKKEYAALETEFGNLVTEIKENIGSDYFTSEKNEKKITIFVPLGDAMIEIEYLSVQKWQAISITFK